MLSKGQIKLFEKKGGKKEDYNFEEIVSDNKKYYISTDADNKVFIVEENDYKDFLKKKAEKNKKIYIVYKITNTITGDFYIGSSNNIKKSLAKHKCKFVWIEIPNDQLYQDMQKYGDDKFVFEVLEEVEIDKLKEIEQKFIEKLQPTYNQMDANDLDIER